MLRAALFSLLIFPATVAAQTRLADSFSGLPPGASVVVMPLDIELFEISAGGVVEPRDDWTTAAERRVIEGFHKRKAGLGVRLSAFPKEHQEAVSEVVRLHRAVSEAIVVHHFGSRKLPTKEGKLDWSLGPDAAPLAELSGADYALFAWIRDTYASGARKATMAIGALFGAALTGGEQLAYTSLVELKTGRVVWFNRVRRMSGDLREAEAAEETLEALLEGFPR